MPETRQARRLRERTMEKARGGRSARRMRRAWVRTAPSRGEIHGFMQRQFDRFQHQQAQGIALRTVVGVVGAAAAGAVIAFAILRAGWLPVQ